MPQLDPKMAKEVAEAESGWEMAPDIYKMQLTAVQDKNPKTNEPLIGKESGEPYWRWELTIPDNAAKYRRRKLWYTTSHGDKGKGMMREAFEAFGADTTTNTDTLLGLFCLVQVDNVARRDQPNSMEAKPMKLMPLPPDDPDFKKSGAVKSGTKSAAKNEADKKEAEALY